MPTITLEENKTQSIFYLIIVILAIFVFFISYLLAQNALFGLGAAIILVTLIIFYQRPDIGIYLAIFSIIPGQLIRFQLEGGSGITLSDLILPLLFLVWLLRKLVKREKIPSSHLGAFLLLFLAIAALSLLNGLRFIEIKEALTPLFYLIRLVSYVGLFYIAADVFKSKRAIYVYKKIILIIFTFVAIAGLLQLIFFPSLKAFSRRGGWDPHIGRLFSTFLDPNFVGAFLVIGLIFILSFFFFSRTIEAKAVLGISIILVLTAIILTYSRSAYLFLLISFLVLGIYRSKKLILFGALLLIALAIIFPRTTARIQGGFDIDASAKYRFDSWERATAIARDNSLLGVGYNAYRYAQIRYGYITEKSYDQTSSGSDASLLTIFVTTGFFGLTAYLIFYVAAIKKSFDSFIHDKYWQKKVIALAIGAILPGLLINSIFINSLLYPAIMIIIFSGLGIISIKHNERI